MIGGKKILFSMMFLTLNQCILKEKKIEKKNFFEEKSYFEKIFKDLSFL